MASLPSHIAAALRVRPAVAADADLRAGNVHMMLVHAVARDGLPPQLGGGDSDARRWEDDVYTAALRDAASGDDEAEDVPEAVVCLFGVTAAGNSAMIAVQGYRPWIRVEMAEAHGPSDAEAMRFELAEDFRLKDTTTVEVTFERLKRFYGWIPDRADPTHTRRYACAKFTFASWGAANTAARMIADRIGGKRAADGKISKFAGCRLTDAQVKPLSRFMNDIGLTPSDWVRCTGGVKLDTSVSRHSTCQLEFTARVTQCAPAPADAIAPLLIMSFDGEMFSHDGAFPSVLKADTTICIGATFWQYGAPLDSIKRFVLCVGDAAKPDGPEGVELACFATSTELMEALRDITVAADPDIVTGWNTYGFDFPFMHADYETAFLPPDLRGSEALQVYAVQTARAVRGMAPLESVPTAAALLAQVRARNPSRLRELLPKLERLVGCRHVKALLKQERALRTAGAGGSAALTTFGGDGSGGAADADDDDRASAASSDDDEEEGGGAMGADGLAAKEARALREALRVEILGAAGAAAASARAPTTFQTLLRDATEDQRAAFWARIEETQGAAVARMLHTRAAPMGAPRRGLFLGRMATERSELLEKRMSSAAKGDNTYYFWGMTGRIQVDLMQVIKDDKKPDDNTLRYAALHWLGGGADVEKLDLSASDMFAAYASRDPTQLWRICDYCVRDTEIPIRLIAKLSYVPVWIEMSRVCYTSANEVINSGQQVKVFNLIARFTWGEYALNVRDSGWPVNDYSAFDEDDGDFKKRRPDYQGATVIEPIKGFYEDCISTLDFESLYPSIIRYFNLCPSALVIDDVYKTLDGRDARVTLERHDIQHNVLTGYVGGKPAYAQETRTYTFVTHIQGVLPRLLKRLLDARKAVKRLMAEATDPLQKAVLNGRQNGIKVACNSVYGFCGVAADRGLLPCKPVAAVTTLKGRAFIEAAKSYVEGHYEGSKVIYGDTDSVMIRWGKGIDVDEAARMGVEAAAAITARLRSGAIAEIGGAGALAAAAAAASAVAAAARGGAGDSGAALVASVASSPAASAKGKVRSPVRDLSEACSAVSLAYEKTYRPYLLLKKKNYVGLKYTEDGKGGFKTELDMKGIDAVRRDRPKLLRETSLGVLRALMYERSVPTALGVLRDALGSIAGGDTPLEDFVLSKSLKGSYASNNLPHVRAWQRMTERGDEGIPPIGARMPYVVVVDASGGGGKKSATKLYDRTEHPAHVKAARLGVDRQYYVETLQNPLVKLLQFVAPDATLKQIFRDAVERAAIRASGIGSLRDFGSDVRASVIVRAPPSVAAPVSSSAGAGAKPGTKRKAADAALPPATSLRTFLLGGGGGGGGT